MVNFSVKYWEIRYLLIVVFVFILNAKTYSQHPYFYSLNNENGLVSNEVLQDIFGLD